MTGWTIYNHRLEQLLSGHDAPDIEAIHSTCRQKVEAAVQELK